MNLTLVVLAAGIGSRYGGLKQVDPVGPSGEFVVDYSVFDALRAGFDNVVFVIRRDIEEAFRSTIGARVEKRVPTRYVYQELTDLPAGFSLPADRRKPWGTGHAILVCKEAVKTPFATVNADDFYGRHSYKVLADYLRQTATDTARYCMVGYVLNNSLSGHGSVARGICSADSEGNLRRVVERLKIERRDGKVQCQGDGEGETLELSGSETASLNMWGFKPSLFAHLDREFREFLGKSGSNPKLEFFIPDVVDLLINRKQATVKVLQTTSVWFGMTHPQDKAEVVGRIGDMVKAGDYPDNLWA
ncbi:MAG: nucleotidyltransferase [Verrucomicrobia bacterium]|nr:nucleotidyltransferase [Verrucomicrobiota bacterium]